MGGDRGWDFVNVVNSPVMLILLLMALLMMIPILLLPLLLPLLPLLPLPLLPPLWVVPGGGSGQAPAASAVRLPWIFRRNRIPAWAAVVHARQGVT